MNKRKWTRADFEKIFNGPEHYGYTGFNAEYDKAELSKAVQKQALRIKRKRVLTEISPDSNLEIHHRCDSLGRIEATLRDYCKRNNLAWEPLEFLTGQTGPDVIIGDVAVEIGWTVAGKVLRHLEYMDDINEVWVFPYRDRSYTTTGYYYIFARGKTWAEYCADRFLKMAQTYNRMWDNGDKNGNVL